MKRRLLNLGCALLCALTFSIVFIGRGHGVGPLGMLLLSPELVVGEIGLLLAYAGIALMVASCLLRQGNGSMFTASIGAALVGIAWLLNTGASLRYSFTWITSAPFFVAMTLFALRHVPVRLTPGTVIRATK